MKLSDVFRRKAFLHDQAADLLPAEAKCHKKKAKLLREAAKLLEKIGE